MLELRAPSWADFSVAFSAKYLGFYLGPAKDGRAWDKPIEKFLERAAAWGGIGGGAFLCIRAYQVYMCSVLMFVAQLELPPPRLDAAVREACRRLFRGPRGWLPPTVLSSLKSLGSSNELVDIRTAAIAAKYRVLTCENEKRGGLHVRRRARALERLLRTTPSSTVGLTWLGWFRRSVLFNLRDAELAISSSSDRSRAADDAAERLELRRSCQREMYAQLREGALSAQVTALHLQRRLDRAQMDLLPGHRPQRATALLQGLWGQVAPRVWHAVLRLLCDGFHFPPGRTGCIFGCTAPDAIHHYASCVVYHRFRYSLPNLQPPEPERRASAFYLLHPRFCAGSARYLVTGACAVYALYTTHCRCSHSVMTHRQAADALRQRFAEARRS